ncbi:hypothetical protein D3C72_725410 [compost metagenome]
MTTSALLISTVGIEFRSFSLETRRPSIRTRVRLTPRPRRSTGAPPAPVLVLVVWGDWVARNCGMSFRAAATFWRAPTDRSSAVRRTVGVGAVKPARSIRDAVTTISSMVVGLPADSSSCV